MKTPTPEQVLTIKADAAKRFGSDRALLVELDAPIDAAVVVAPFNLVTWNDYVDAQARDIDTSHVGAIVDRLLWPSLDVFTALREAWPAAPRIIAQKMHVAAGETLVKAVVTRLLSTSTPPLGLTAEKAAALIANAGTAALWAVQLPGVASSCVMQTPLADVYLAAKAADRAAKDRGIGRITAMLAYVLETVVWSSEPIDQVLNRLPALSSDLRLAFGEMGGEGATTRSKSL